MIYDSVLYYIMEYYDAICVMIACYDMVVCCNGAVCHTMTVCSDSDSENLFNINR